jgi:hypothetical protein
MSAILASPLSSCLVLLAGWILIGIAGLVRPMSVQFAGRTLFLAGALCGVLEAGPGGEISRCHPHDPSWQNWPVLEHPIIGNIVPDFPLINKSFNLSYSGHDL